MTPPQNGTEHLMDEHTREMSLSVNALLMAIDTDNREAIESLMEDAGEHQGELLFRTINTLKSMVNMLLEAIEDVADHTEVDFASLVKMNAEYLIESEITDDES